MDRLLMKGLISLIFYILFATVNAQDVNQFSTRFYKEIIGIKPQDSVICSPLSAQIALGFLSVGARGDTQKELNTALFLPDTGAEVFKSTITNLENVSGIQLKIANKIYVPDSPGYDLSPDFQQKAVDIFRSDIQSINFADSKNAATTINTWVEGKTDNKIKDLIKSDDVGPNTNLVLVNAIYFKGTWKNKFDEKLTKKKIFYLNSKDKIEVDMMSHTANYSYAFIPSLEARVLEMPYAGEDASMVILLPTEIEGLSQLEEKIATTDLKKEVFDTLPNPSEIPLYIPKFKIETTMQLKSKVLPNLGIKLIFGNGDLTGIFSSYKNIVVSNVIQKAFIEVNEEGTTAAAATAIIGTYGASNDFNVNRPFIFLIKKSSGEILFIGRYGVNITGTPVTDVTEGPIIPEEPEPYPTRRPWYRPWIPKFRRYPRYYRK